MITSSLVPASVASVFSATIGKSYAITNTIICNYTTTLSGSIDIYLVKSGDSATNANKIVYNRIIDPSDSLFISDKFLLTDGDSLRIGSSIANTYSATIVYVEI